MKLILFIVFPFITLFCNERQKISENKTKFSYRKDSVLLLNTVYHEFSQPDNKDKFLICIRGKSLIEGQLIITITNIEGNEIYCEVFPSNYLIDYGFTLGQAATEKDQEVYIKKRFEEFFDEKKFSKPAIKSDDKYVEDISSKEYWEEIKADQTAIGFHYVIGEEDIRSIAFSKKSNKVVMYANCC